MFIGGLSAATGMVIVETIALSTMVCNDLVMPVLLRMRSLRLNERRDLTGLLLGIRRGAIVLILLLGYCTSAWQARLGLVSIGDLVRRGGAVRRRQPSAAFSGRAARRGALAGLIAGSSYGRTRFSCPRSRARLAPDRGSSEGDLGTSS